MQCFLFYINKLTMTFFFFFFLYSFFPFSKTASCVAIVFFHLLYQTSCGLNLHR